MHHVDVHERVSRQKTSARVIALNGVGSPAVEEGQVVKAPIEGYNDPSGLNFSQYLLQRVKGATIASEAALATCILGWSHLQGRHLKLPRCSFVRAGESKRRKRSYPVLVPPRLARHLDDKHFRGRYLLRTRFNIENEP